MVTASFSDSLDEVLSKYHTVKYKNLGQSETDWYGLKQAIIKLVDEREEASFERGRIADAEICENTQRHDARLIAKQIKLRGSVDEMGDVA